MNPRRERFRGQDVLVFDFEPNPEFKAHKLAEKVVQKLAGVIWIDEKATTWRGSKLTLSAISS